MATLDLEPTDFKFDSGDIDLEGEAVNYTLRCDVANAEVGISIGDIELRKASIGGVFEEVTYGTCDGKPACFLRLAVEFQSTKDFRLQTAELHCEFDCDSSGNSAKPTKNASRPRVLRRHPAEPMAEPLSTSVSMTHGFELNPHIEAGGFGGEGFKWTNEQSFVRNVGWEISSRITSSPGTTSRNRVSWFATGNSYQKTGPKQMIEIKILVEHCNEPFHALFRFKGKLNFGAQIGMLGRSHEITCRRNFSPQASSASFERNFPS